MVRKDSTYILKVWLERHKSNPYPSLEEKEELMKLTNLDRSQLDHWFVNARQRYCRPKRRRGPNPNYSRYPERVTKILIDWLLVNKDKPYPSTEDQAFLLERTGLRKKQLQNWFTNARKRDLVRRLSTKGTSDDELDNVMSSPIHRSHSPSALNYHKQHGITRSTAHNGSDRAIYPYLNGNNELTVELPKLDQNGSYNVITPLFSPMNQQKQAIGMLQQQIPSNGQQQFVTKVPLSPTSLGQIQQFQDGSHSHPQNGPQQQNHHQQSQQQFQQINPILLSSAFNSIGSVPPFSPTSDSTPRSTSLGSEAMDPQQTKDLRFCTYPQQQYVFANGVQQAQNNSAQPYSQVDQQQHQQAQQNAYHVWNAQQQQQQSKQQPSQQQYFQQQAHGQQRPQPIRTADTFILSTPSSPTETSNASHQLQYLCVSPRTAVHQTNEPEPQHSTQANNYNNLLAIMSNNQPSHVMYNNQGNHISQQQQFQQQAKNQLGRVVVVGKDFQDQSPLSGALKRKDCKDVQFPNGSKRIRMEYLDTSAASSVHPADSIFSFPEKFQPQRKQLQL